MSTLWNKRYQWRVFAVINIIMYVCMCIILCFYFLSILLYLFWGSFLVSWVWNLIAYLLILLWRTICVCACVVVTMNTFAWTSEGVLYWRDTSVFKYLESVFFQVPVHPWHFTVAGSHFPNVKTVSSIESL